MNQKSLIEELLEETDNPLLAKLIENYHQNRTKEKDEITKILVSQMQAEFKERIHADS